MKLLVLNKEDFEKAMKEFAEYPVNKALEKAWLNSKLTGTWGKEDYTTSSIALREIDGAWIDLEIDKESILNCYKNEIK